MITARIIKCILRVSIPVIALFLHACKEHTQDPANKTPEPEKVTFLAQKPPGMTPEVFAPGLVSTGALEIEAALSPGMQEFYFVRQEDGESPKLHLIEYRDGQWHESETERPSGEVFISTDNQTMYLGNNYKERTATGWTEEKSLEPLLEDFPIMRLSASVAGTYVFDEREEFGLIRYSRLIDGQREAPQLFDEVINTGRYTAHPFIAPDESFLIWDSEREGGYGGSDLYISFRLADGSWGPAINMGPAINSEIDDAYGSVSADGNYFFFNRIHLGETMEESEADIYWVDARVIEDLRDN